jgi:2-oxoglutarate dehydrogenase E1 component
MHMLNRDQCNWIRTKVEHLVKEEDSKAKRMHILERLAFSVVFERFLGNKYNTTKRFGLDGAESLIPGMKFLIDRATELGMEHLVIGMPHRGRLNVLSNVIRKPIQQIFKEFQGTHFDVEAYRAESDVEDWSNSGDVKYHLGTSYDRAYPDGRQVHLSLVANPSHLEAVDPVVVGKVRAKQFYLGNDDEAERKVMPMLLHGDAAFSGQGVVYETMHLSGLDNYDTGGTVHVVVNNQIGFTTDPKNSRSSQYCTDLGKAMDVPILHVNGDDPEAVVKVFEFAAEWRQQWRSDVIINLTCYRRFGHNEIDNPFFTQPIMYKKIGQMQSVLDLYVQKLVATNAASQQECNAVVDKVNQFFQSTFEESNEWEPMKKSDWLANRWESFKSPNQQSRIRPTGVSLDLLKHVGDKICATPEGFKLNRQLQRIIGAKKATIEAGEGIDWGTAEALAWGTLLLEGNHVRISGQDVERGTFSHRHAVLHDQETNDEFVPLNSLAPRTLKSAPLEYKPLGNEVPDTQAEFVASNSSLSEFGVLGFELGYSLENPNALVMWEAQFGDFANGAQIMIDQFLSAGEDKWMRQSGLVMLLPHGYEGQGAEHSSCRVERFLQMTDDEPDVVPVMDEDNRMQIQHTNWQVVYCSTPAQYFHVLRRQLHREFRKPLISVQPKHLLRLRQAASKVEDMAEGTKFHRLLPEVSTSLVADASVKRVVFCSGKVYYDMVAERDARGINDIALVRVEQIAPFPFDKVAEQAARYSNAEIVWAQEEPHNMGFWTYVSPRIETALTKINGDSARRPRYIGRPPAAAPATGYNAVHQIEQARIVDKALA